MDLVLLTSLNSYISTLRLARFALLRIPARSKSNNTNARLMTFTLSLTLDPMFGIHSHKISGNAQLLHLQDKPENFPFFTVLPFQLTSVATSLIRNCISVYVCVCVCVLMLVCVCVCVDINASVCVLVRTIHLLIR